MFADMADENIEPETFFRQIYVNMLSVAEYLLA